MIKAYVAGIINLYEGEDIELRYSIYEDESLLAKEFLVTKYKKPAVVGAVALHKLLKALEQFKDKEITIFMNEAALYEFIKGTGWTKNKDVQNIVGEIQYELSKFDQVVIKDVGKDHKELEKWNEVLQAKESQI